jgi:hypothetical protein
MKAVVYRRYGGPEVLEYTTSGPEAFPDQRAGAPPAAALNAADHHEQRVPRWQS